MKLNPLDQDFDMNTRNEIIRFLIVGTAVNATGFSIYYCMFHFVSFNLAKGISFTCASILAYLFNKYWTFKRPQVSYAEFGRYLFINLLALGINIFINHSILSHYPGDILLALLSASMVTALFIYISSKCWVFKLSSCG